LEEASLPPLRDRDAIIVAEGIIFRVYGYWHPPGAYVCDVEYAPSSIYRSEDPRAPRTGGGKTYYKFYADGGLRFVLEKYPQYTVYYRPLGRRLVGVHEEQIRAVRLPQKALERLLASTSKNTLLDALREVITTVSDEAGVKIGNFGVFGSLLHGFYHPEYSDLDFTVYGGEALEKLREALKTLYGRRSAYQNEFSSPEALRGKRWRFLHYTPEEYLWHQRRKLIYGVYLGEKRRIKFEFEPVKEWHEIRNEYDPETRITRLGWVRAKATVVDDSESAFMPSVYQIDETRILEGPQNIKPYRILSYVEEYRLQAFTGERVYVEGWLERLEDPSGVRHQITLSYGPRYYEQTLKVAER